MIFTLDDNEVVEGTILLFGIRYGASTSGKVYTFAGLKAGGRWYFTGTGPTDASWSAVQRWLQRDGRQVVWVKAVTGMDLLWEGESAAKANHPSRTGSPAASMRNMMGDPSADADLVTPQQRAADKASAFHRLVLSTVGADELLDAVSESSSSYEVDDGALPERAPWEYEADELLEEIPESTSRETFDDHGVDPYGD